MHAWAAPETNNVILNFCIHLLSAGYFGVPFFFTLSSFLITYNLLVQKSVTGSISLAGFYRNRILRIWPVYFILVFFCFVLLPFISTYLHTAPASLPPVWPFLFFYVNFYIIHHGMGFTFALSILWSISIEEQFYLVWAPLMKLLKKNWLIPVIIVLSAISILFSWHYLYVRYQPVSNLHIQDRKSVV